ncbi:MAG TPA: choice-of-anchor Q domain-containing protein [Mycobacteriales bacterium]|jgi:hypothetical protein|nr:choice-of-anchor Q domain-containing protein [Mycobacteriales bacterium]
MAMMVAGIVAPAMSQASTVYTVTTTADSGTGSLRAALGSALDGDEVTFASSVTGSIDLQSPLEVSHSVTIDGPGAGVLSIDGQHQVEDLIVNDSNAGTVSISGLTFTHGKGQTGGGIGVAAGSNVALSHVRVTDNAATAQGGGIYLTGANVSLFKTTVSGNTAPDGGGVFADLPSGSHLSVLRSTISGNTAASGQGAAVEAQGESRYVAASTSTKYSCPEGESLVDGNECTPYYIPLGSFYYCEEGSLTGSEGDYTCVDQYAATYNTESGEYECDGAELVGDECYRDYGSADKDYYGGYYTCSRKEAFNSRDGRLQPRSVQPEYCDSYAYTSYSPGAYLAPGSVSISISTVAGNTAPSGDAALYFKGLDGSSSVGSSTVASNQAAGIGVDAKSEAPTLGASIVAGNNKDCVGTAPVDGGFNLDSDGSCALTATGSHSSAAGIVAALGALADNGGPTQTIALARTSDPAHGVVPATFAAPGASSPVCTLNDQRGVAAAGTPCDIGAFQVEKAPTITATAKHINVHRVRVTFHCHSASPAISITCPPPVTVHGNGSHTVTGKVVAQDGRTASVSKTVQIGPAGSSRIHVAVTGIDRTGNRVTRQGSYTAS